MKKMLVGILMVHGIVFGMEKEEQRDAAPASVSAVAYQPKDSDFLMWGGIERSNCTEVLQGLKDGANQNYLWTHDDATYKQYVDFTAIMFAMKQVRKKNRCNYASILASAAVWDVGKHFAKSVLAEFLPQYPFLKYAEPVWNSRTASVFLESQQRSRVVVEPYRPEKDLLYALLLKDDTDLKVARKTMWEGKPVTAMTYLNGMTRSWNPLTRDDGGEIMSRLSQAQRKKAGLPEQPMQMAHAISRPFMTGMIEEEDPGIALARLEAGSANNPRRNRLYYYMPGSNYSANLY